MRGSKKWEKEGKRKTERQGKQKDKERKGKRKPQRVGLDVVKSHQLHILAIFRPQQLLAGMTMRWRLLCHACKATVTTLVG